LCGCGIGVGNRGVPEKNEEGCKIKIRYDRGIGCKSSGFGTLFCIEILSYGNMKSSHVKNTLHGILVRMEDVAVATMLFQSIIKCKKNCKRK